ncbi:MAG TPA: hypothetical protein VFX45_02425 [Solirubrobacterales bacterium]|nr:hypothetical protein [Solirubrobacterales bacterium]
MSTIAVFLVLGGATAVAAKKIGTNEIKGSSITTGKVKKEAITRGKIKKAAIDASRLADGSVTTSKIADSAVTTGRIAGEAVTTGKLANGAVSTAKLSADAQPTQVASLTVTSNGNLVSSTPGVSVKRVGKGAYCVGLPFVPKGGAASTAGSADPLTAAHVNVPADLLNCNIPGFQSAAVYVLDESGGLSDQSWTAIFR